MNCQAREFSVSKRYCTSFSSYKEGSYSSFFWNEYLIVDSENLCVQNMDLELIWNGSSTLLSMIGSSWMKNIELTPRCIYTANLPLSLFNTKDTHCHTSSNKLFVSFSQLKMASHQSQQYSSPGYHSSVPRESMAKVG